MTEKKESKEIKILIEQIDESNAPAIYVAGGLNKFFEAVKAEVTGEVPDLSTAKGRARIASLAAAVSKSKTAVEKPGRDYLKRLKEMPKIVEAELREFTQGMDALRDATRQPLTDWEKANDERIDRHNDAIQAIKDACLFDSSIPQSSLVRSELERIEAVVIDDSWEEFIGDAAQAKDQAVSKLRAILAESERYEAQQHELARLRAEKEAQAQRDREAEIARQAAEQARIHAKKQAQEELDAAVKREADARAEAERRELELKLAAEQAERAAAQAARDKIEAEQRAAKQKADDELRHRQQMEQAEANRIAAEKRAEQERIDAERRQAEAVERARQDEIDRQHAAAEEEKRQAQEREADRDHKSKVMGAAKTAIMEAGASEELAKEIVLKIARGQVPNVKINF